MVSPYALTGDLSNRLLGLHLNLVCFHSSSRRCICSFQTVNVVRTALATPTKAALNDSQNGVRALPVVMSISNSLLAFLLRNEPEILEVPMPQLSHIEGQSRRFRYILPAI